MHDPALFFRSRLRAALARRRRLRGLPSPDLAAEIRSAWRAMHDARRAAAAAAQEPDHGVVECRACGRLALRAGPGQPGRTSCACGAPAAASRPHRGGVPLAETLTYLVIDPSMPLMTGTEIARLRLAPRCRAEADQREAIEIADQVLDQHGEAFRALKDL